MGESTPADVRHRPPRRRPGRSPGFTLVELLVVLVLIGLVGALVVPSAHGVYERHRLRLELNRMIDFLSGAPSAAYLGGTELALHGEGTRLELRPDGPTLRLAGPWRLEVARGLRYWSNGAASGGVLHARHGERRFQLEQRAGDGAVTVDDGERRPATTAGGSVAAVGGW